MGKLTALVKNEYIKQLKKRSTIIILILTAIVSVGFTGIVKLSTLEMTDMGDYTPDTSYSVEIEDARRNGDDKSLEYYTFLSEQGISTADWRYDPAVTALGDGSFDSVAGYVQKNSSEDISGRFRDFVINKDWKGYYGFIKDKLPEEARWAVEFRLENDIAPDENMYSEDADWRNVQLDQYLQYALKKSKVSSEQMKTNYDDAMKTARYRLEHDIAFNVAGTSMTDMERVMYEDEPMPTSNKFTMWTAFTTSPSVVSFVGLLIIIIAGSIVASEFSNGTIKFLLINPRSRGKILISKYITVVTAGLVMIVLCFIVSLLTAGLMFGFGEAGATYVKTTAGETTAVPGILYIFGQYMLKGVYVLVMATFSFALSSLVKSSSLAIGLGIFAMTMGESVVMMLKQAFGIDAVRYTIFANYDIQSIASGQTIFAGQTIGFALIIIAIHMVVFLLTAWDGFTRRDV